MIKELETILNKVIEYRKTIHDGTTSILIDKWIETTKQMIQEISLMYERNA